MKLFILLLSVFLILSGVTLLFNPSFIYEFVENNKGNVSMYASAIAARLIFGILLILSAKASIYPVIIKVLGFLLIMLAVIFIFIGLEGFQDLISSLLPFFRPYSWMVGLLSMAFGGFLIYAFSAEKKVVKKGH